MSIAWPSASPVINDPHCYLHLKWDLKFQRVRKDAVSVNWRHICITFCYDRARKQSLKREVIICVIISVTVT